jgi:hypothetical protein
LIGVLIKSLIAFFLSPARILTTLPLFRQRAQTFMVFRFVPTIVFTFMRFGFHTRRRAFFAWLIVLPLTVPFPQMSHRLAIKIPPSCLMGRA